MPLLDHFHPPLSLRRHWESFHAAWATAIMRHLNRSVLPEGFFAEAQVHVGSRVEIDVATFNGDRNDSAETASGALGVALATYSPPAAHATMPAVFPDEIEVQVFDTTTGPTLVGAIELVSPGNKDRTESRQAFAAKCASYLHMGIGLVIVDIVTERQANLHNSLIELLGPPNPLRFPGLASLYAVSYRPRRTELGDEIELWFHTLALGETLPTMPLALRGNATVPVDFEETYTEVREDSRL